MCWIFIYFQYVFRYAVHLKKLCMPHEKSSKYSWEPRNDDWFCLPPSVVLKIFDPPGRCFDLFVDKHKRAFSFWLKSVAWPVGPVLKFRDIPDCVRAVTILTLEHNFAFTARHIPGLDNSIADSLSRFQMDRFRHLAPNASPSPCVIPPLATSI